MTNNIIQKLKNKKKPLIIFTILVVMILLISLVVIKISKTAIENLTSNKSWIEKHISLVKATNISSNVYTVKKSKYIKTYNTLYQNSIDEEIEKLTNKNSYTLNDPLMIYNPYGTNTNSLNIYFATEEETTISYKIEVDGYSSFERILKNTGEDNYTTNHSYQLIGFIMGHENKLTITVKTKNQEITKYKFKLNFKNYKINTDTKLKITKDSKEELTDGLYAILGDSREDDYIHIVDNDGVVRGEIPIIGYRAVNLLFNNEKMYFSISERKIAEMNNLGKITKIYRLGKYRFHHDYSFDKNKENILVLATDTTDDSCEDAIIKLNLKTGKVTDSFKLEEVLADLRKSAYYNKSEVAKEVESVGVDWMHINTINYFDNDTVILSSRETSSIIKIKDIFNNPEIVYILGDEEFYSNFDSKKYLYKKTNDFTIAGGQHTVSYIPTDDEKVYYLSMFNNNIGISTTQPNFNWKKIGLKYSSPKDDGTSYYYKYKIDENKKTYELVESFEVPFSAYMGSSQEYKNNIIIDSAQQCTFQETDSKGNIKRQYKFNCKSSVYRVFKYTFNDFYYVDD